MKKRIIILLCATFSFMLLTTNIKAVDTKATEEQIRAFVYTFDNIESTVKYVRDLKDINNETSFSLYEIEGKGFAVTVKSTGNIVDVVYANIPDETKLYYVGPNTFVESITSKGRSAIDSEEVKESTENILNEEKLSFTLERNQSKARKINGDNDNKPSVVKGGTEYGIADSRMDLFNGSWWVNTGSYCGAFTGSAMVTYMDKYFGGRYINEYKPINNGKDYCEYIVSRFKERIPGTTSSYGLIRAINSVMMADYPTDGKTASSTATESTYKSKMKANRPVILALSDFKASPYGFHFVLAYRYIDYNGYLWFKAYDNWSGANNRGWISRNWVQDGIYLN